MKKSKNIVAVKHRVNSRQRWHTNKHKGGVLWFTGLPGSGKSTLAIELEHRLCQDGKQAYVLDGDNIRHGLSSDLGFSPKDRTENIRRIGEVAASTHIELLQTRAALSHRHHRGIGCWITVIIHPHHVPPVSHSGLVHCCPHRNNSRHWCVLAGAELVP